MQETVAACRGIWRLDRTMGEQKRNSRFERHPLLAWALIATLLLVLAELALRTFDPEAVRFASDSRRVYRYHERWYTDFEPDTTTTVRLSDGQQGYYLNFLLTVNKYGFRWHDRLLDAPLPDPAESRVIHAIGDSFTMGWGVNYESSYPARLQELLPPGYAVLNPGLNGYGTIGATEKSLALATEFPPAAVVYLATDNDYSDDEIALRYAARPAIAHVSFDLLNVLRRHTQLPNVWYAVRWWLYYRPGRNAISTPWVDPRGVTVSQLQLTGAADPEIGSPSKAALSFFISELREKGIPLIVIAHGTGSAAVDIARFSAEHGVPSYLIDFPEALRLRREGHLNREGNARLAEYVLGLLDANGIVSATSVGFSS